MKKVRLLDAVRRYCLECSGGSRREVAECAIPDCELYPFRYGKNPYRKGVGSVSNMTKNGDSPEGESLR